MRRGRGLEDGMERELAEGLELVMDPRPATGARSEMDSGLGLASDSGTETA